METQDGSTGSIAKRSGSATTIWNLLPWLVWQTRHRTQSLCPAQPYRLARAAVILWFQSVVTTVSSVSGSWFSPHVNSSRKGQRGCMAEAVQSSQALKSSIPYLILWKSKYNTVSESTSSTIGNTCVWKCSSGVTCLPVVSRFKWLMFIPALFSQSSWEVLSNMVDLWHSSKYFFFSCSASFPCLLVPPVSSFLLPSGCLDQPPLCSLFCPFSQSFTHVLSGCVSENVTPNLIFFFFLFPCEIGSFLSIESVLSVL